MLWALDPHYYPENFELEQAELPSRLIISHPPIYERWDRLDAEADFRLQMSLPVLALLLVACYQLGAFQQLPSLLAALLLSVVVAVVLLRSGAAKRYEADSQLVEAMSARVLQSPLVEDIGKGVIAWRYPEIAQLLRQLEFSAEQRLDLLAELTWIEDVDALRARLRAGR